MKRTRQYRAFTLVEMLVVMGILVILMTMGIAAGRFAIQRANRVQHTNAVDQLYQGFQSYYADNREFPDDTTFGAGFGEALDTGALAKYVDAKAFDGGSDATYYYAVESDAGQSVLVCVSYGGPNDENDQGGYCNGNGFGALPEGATSNVDRKDLDESEFQTQVLDNVGSFQAVSDWSGSDRVWNDR